MIIERQHIALTQQIKLFQLKFLLLNGPNRIAGRLKFEQNNLVIEVENFIKETSAFTHFVLSANKFIVFIL